MIRHKQITRLDPGFVNQKLQEFFKEDEISEDITTKATQQNNKTVEANFIAKEKMIFAGKEIIIQGFQECKIIAIKKDGEEIEKGDIIAKLNSKNIAAPFSGI